MITSTRKFLHIILGIFIVILGVAGLVLPIINGTVLLIVGFILLSFESLFVEKHLNNLTKRNSFIHGIHLKLDVFLRKLFRK